MHLLTAELREPVPSCRTAEVIHVVTVPNSRAGAPLLDRQALGAVCAGAMSGRYDSCSAQDLHVGP